MRLGLALVLVFLVGASTPAWAETPAEVTEKLAADLSSRICPASPEGFKHFRIRRLCAELKTPGEHAACIEEVYHANRLIQRYNRFVEQCRSDQ